MTSRVSVLKILSLLMEFARVSFQSFRNLNNLYPFCWKDFLVIVYEFSKRNINNKSSKYLFYLFNKSLFNLLTAFCAALSCSSAEVCVDTPTGGQCNCAVGYERASSGRCEIVDECLAIGFTCSQEEVCMQDLITLNFMCVCKSGYTLIDGVCIGEFMLLL